MPRPVPAVTGRFAAASARAASASGATVPAEYPEKEARFGETHIHTACSFDGGGERPALPAQEASRAGRGDRPRRVSPRDGDDPPSRRPRPQRPHGAGAARPQHAAGAGALDLNFQTASAWRRSVEASKRHNQPGVFSTLVGYEWTLAPGGANLRRNLLFRTGQGPPMVMSALDLNNEEKLWGWMASLEDQGMRARFEPLQIGVCLRHRQPQRHPRQHGGGQRLGLQLWRRRWHGDSAVREAMLMPDAVR